jgi:hypothetical protein
MNRESISFEHANRARDDVGGRVFVVIVVSIVRVTNRAVVELCRSRGPILFTRTLVAAGTVTAFEKSWDVQKYIYKKNNRPMCVPRPLLFVRTVNLPQSQAKTVKNEASITEVYVLNSVPQLKLSPLHACVTPMGTSAIKE